MLLLSTLSVDAKLGTSIEGSDHCSDTAFCAVVLRNWDSFYIPCHSWSKTRVVLLAACVSFHFFSQWEICTFLYKIKRHLIFLQVALKIRITAIRVWVVQDSYLDEVLKCHGLLVFTKQIYSLNALVYVWDYLQLQWHNSKVPDVTYSIPLLKDF